MANYQTTMLSGIELCDIQKGIQHIESQSSIVPFYLELMPRIDSTLGYRSVLSTQGAQGVVLKVMHGCKEHALKITKAERLNREAALLAEFEGVQGIPQLRKKYMDKKDNVLAILREYIDGCTLIRYGEVGIRFNAQMQIMKREFMKKGYLLPMDINSDNILVDCNGNIHIIDLGRVKKTETATEYEKRTLEKMIGTLIQRFGN